MGRGNGGVSYVEMQDIVRVFEPEAAGRAGVRIGKLPTDVVGNSGKSMPRSLSSFRLIGYPLISFATCAVNSSLRMA